MRISLGATKLLGGEVRAVQAGTQTIALTSHQGMIGALDNACPHQGGPLGEGSIEGGWLRCPWHGWDFHPLTGKPPGGFDDGVETFPVEVREDGVYVLDEMGNRELICRVTNGLRPLDATPLRPRPKPPVIPTGTTSTKWKSAPMMGRGKPRHS